MTKISRIHMLVHPDFTAKFHGQTTLNLHALQRELRAGWERRAFEVSKSPNDLLVYVSAFDAVQLDAAKPCKPILGGLLSEDLERIKRFKEQLDDRLIVLPGEFYHTLTLSDEAVKERGVEYDHNNLSLTVFGEYDEDCVDAWGEAVKEMLEIPDDRYVIDGSVSFPASRLHEVFEWGRRTKEG